MIFAVVILVIGMASWVTIAILLGMLIGRIVRYRDRQEPRN